MGILCQNIRPLFLKLCVALALLSMSVANATPTSTPIAVSDLPAAIVSAVNSAAPGATIVSCAQVSDNGTVMGYQVQAQSGTTAYQFAIAASGRILSSSQSSTQTIQPSDLPAAVVAAVNAAAPGATITQCQQNTVNGVVAYAVQAQTSTSKYGFLIDASGNILKTYLQTTVNVTNLPQAVIDAVSAAAPGATINSAQQITGPNGQTMYNVFASDATSQYQFKVSADGTITGSCQQSQIDPSTLPQNVIDAVMTASSGGTIQKAGMTIQNGKTYYIVQVSNNGTMMTVIVDSSGVIQKAVYTQQDIAVSDLPAAVSAAAMAAVPGGTIVKCAMTSDGTRTTYLVGMSLGSKTIGLAIDATGKVLKTFSAPAPSSTNPNAAHSVDVTALPQVVIDAVNNAVPGGTIISAMQGMSKGMTMYKIETVTSDNKDVTLIVDQNGNVGGMRTKQLKTKH